MKRIAIFASGTGTNAENIIRYFQKNDKITVVRVLSNKKDAKVLERAENLNVSTLYFNKNDYPSEITLILFLTL